MVSGCALHNAISVDKEHTRKLIVIQDYLASSASLPSAIGSLTGLISLELNLNKLTGLLPSEMWRMRKLTRLDSGLNQLSGALPVELGRSVSLTYMSLRGNHLTGTIHDSLDFFELTRKSIEWNSIIALQPS